MRLVNAELDDYGINTVERQLYTSLPGDYDLFWELLPLYGKARDTKEGVQEELGTFFDLLRSGDVRALQKLLDSGFNPNTVIAMEWLGRRSVFQKRDLPYPASYRDKPLLLDSQLWNVERFSEVLQKARDCFFFDVSVTPLFCAVRWGRPDFVSLLLSAGANPNYIGPGGQSVLYFLAAECWVSRCVLRESCGRIKESCGRMASCLLEAGAQVNRVDLLGNTPLVAATYACSPILVEVLLKKGADACFCDGQGHPPLISAMRYCFHTPEIESIVSLLLSYGANPNALEVCDGISWTPLQFAASMGFVKSVKALVERGADLESRDEEGNTALLFAIYNLESECVRFLLDVGADCHVKNNHGQGALDLLDACRYNDPYNKIHAKTNWYPANYDPVKCFCRTGEIRALLNMKGIQYR